MKKFIEEFKEFAVRGNVVDLAIGVIIGGAFGKIVSSLVADVIMPPVGVLLGGVNFVDLKITMQKATLENPAVTINAGTFMQTVIDFAIVALVIFLVVTLINRLKRKNKEMETPTLPEKNQEIILLSEIRDLLKNK